MNKNQELIEKVTEAAEEFAKEVESFASVVEITYQVAFRDEESESISLASGSTHTAPDSLRIAMLNEAIRVRGGRV